MKVLGAFLVGFFIISCNSSNLRTGSANFKNYEGTVLTGSPNPSQTPAPSNNPLSSSASASPSPEPSPESECKKSTPEDNTGLRTLFVFDASGSLVTQDPDNHRSSSSIKFYDDLKQSFPTKQMEFSVIRFSTTARLMNENFLSRDDRVGFLKSIQDATRSPGGNTYYAPALVLARQAILKQRAAFPNITTKDVILFFTDGMPMDQNAILDETLLEIRNDNIQFIILGLINSKASKSRSDQLEARMKQIAEATAGSYYLADQPDQLTEAFKKTLDSKILQCE